MNLKVYKNLFCTIALAISLSFLASSSFASNQCEEGLKGTQKNNNPAASSEAKGIVHHGVHLVDLLLYAATPSSPQSRTSFRQNVEQLSTYIKNKEIPFMNEKIDGSPSIVAGFMNGQAFVAYKSQMKRVRGEQALIFSEADARKHYKANNPLRKIFSDLIKAIKPQMDKLPEDYHHQIFQGDLLFSGTNNISKSSTEIEIKPNAIAYNISKNSPYFKDVSRSHAGAVFHSVGNAKIDSNGKVRVSGSGEKSLLYEFIDQINNGKFFALNSIQESVKLKNTESFNAPKAQEHLKNIEGLFEQLSPEFKQQWESKWLAPFKVFFNSSLKPGGAVGVYHLATHPKADFKFSDAVIVDFYNWLTARVASSRFKTYNTKLIQKFDQFRSQHSTELSQMIEAYSRGIAIQHQLMQAMPEVNVSKIGGGPSEGVMLELNGSIVKFVDRLNFTMTNNFKNNRQQDIKNFDLDNFDPNFAHLPHPFKKWRPDALFVILKGQPFHKGHIALIREAVKLGRPLYIVPSDKQANMSAEKWNDFKATSTKKALKAQEYKYIFSPQMRKQLLDLAFENQLPIHFVNPRWFWAGYLPAAKESGQSDQIGFVMGEKEKQAGRYDRQAEEFSNVLELVSIEMQAQGISATQVRKLFLDHHQKPNEQTLEKINDAFSYIKETQVREEKIKALMKEWATIHTKAQELIQP